MCQLIPPPLGYETVRPVSTTSVEPASRGDLVVADSLQDSDDPKIGQYYRSTMTKTTGQVSIEYCEGTVIMLTNAGKLCLIELQRLSSLHIRSKTRQSWSILWCDSSGCDMPNADLVVALDNESPTMFQGYADRPGAMQTLLYSAVDLATDRVHSVQVTNLPSQPNDTGETRAGA